MLKTNATSHLQNKAACIILYHHCILISAQHFEINPQDRVAEHSSFQIEFSAGEV